MIRVGITGGIGSGKTYVSHLLQEFGIPVYDSDSQAKRLTVSDPDIRKGLIHLLGEQVYQGGTLNKELLASYLFGSQEHAARVNAVIHPVVFADFDRWCRDRDTEAEIVGLESAILLESGFHVHTDCIWVVSAPLELRIQRAMQRDGRDRSSVEARIQAQMSDEEREKRADYVIVNDGIQPLLPQLERILYELRQRKKCR